jgi:hypothetical protein
VKLFFYFVIGLSISTCAFAAQPSEKLIAALITVESSGNDQAVGDKHLRQKAYGCLQIRQPVCDDINRRYGTSYKAEDCLGNRKLSIEFCKLYIDMYAKSSRLGRTPTDEDKARIWNGGPNGWRRPSTEGYWKKVHKALED